MAILAKVLLPVSARKIRPAWCPSLPAKAPEYVARGGEDTCVYVYDVTSCLHKGGAPMVISKLVGHDSPVVDVSWSFDEHVLASCDVGGTVYMWQRG